MTMARKAVSIGMAFAIAGIVCPAIGRSGISGGDHPWNPEHIARLPKEVRNTLARICLSPPNAGHYFATYAETSRRINLHYEHIQCRTREPLCRQAGCLHEVYVLTGAHYRLLRSYYGPNND
jgi:hypothetical protein